MKFVVATLLGMHSLAHLVGFVWPLWVSEPLPYPPVPPAPLIDDGSMQTLSVLWLATATAFMAAALARLVSGRSWRDITTAAAVASLVLSLACWPGSFLGIPINAAILGLLRTRRSDRRYV